MYSIVADASRAMKRKPAFSSRNSMSVSSIAANINVKHNWLQRGCDALVIPVLRALVTPALLQLGGWQLNLVGLASHDFPLNDSRNIEFHFDPVEPNGSATFAKRLRVDMSMSLVRYHRKLTFYEAL